MKFSLLKLFHKFTFYTKFSKQKGCYFRGLGHRNTYYLAKVNKKVFAFLVLSFFVILDEGRKIYRYEKFGTKVFSIFLISFVNGPGKTLFKYFL